MARIKLTAGFTTIPEGTYVFQVKDVEYKEEYGKMRIRFVTKDGLTHMEQFSLLDSKGKPNEGAYNAFSYLAKVLLDDFDREEIDEQELVGRFVKCSIEHQVVDKGDGKTATYAHLGKDKEVAYGFDDEPAPTPAPAEDGFDLDAILNS